MLQVDWLVAAFLRTTYCFRTSNSVMHFMTARVIVHVRA